MVKAKAVSSHANRHILKGTGIGVPIHDTGDRKEWVVNAMPGSFTVGKKSGNYVRRGCL
jgi:hypothetical protein